MQYGDELDYTQHIERLRNTDPALASELAGFHALEQVLDWLRGRGLPFTGLDLITQDEYSHDLLAPLPDGRCLSFAMSWFGELTAVAVWPGKPSADQLLTWRLEAGWQPKPSKLQQGPTVLGHAACLARVPD